MPISLVDRIGSDKVCIKPHVGGYGAVVSRLATEEASDSSLLKSLAVESHPPRWPEFVLHSRQWKRPAARRASKNSLSAI